MHSFATQYVDKPYKKLKYSTPNKEEVRGGMKNMKRAILTTILVVVLLVVLSFAQNVCMKGAPKGTVDTWAGPIFSNAQAPSVCPDVCKLNGGIWNKQWRTPQETWGKNSVCGCTYSTNCTNISGTATGPQGLCRGLPNGTVDLWAGPIWNNDIANKTCPSVCQARGATWTKQWQTPTETWGKNSVCSCAFGNVCKG